jgi:hypothetical protein
MVRKPDATRQPTPHDIQLMSKHRVLSFKPQLRLEWRGQDAQNETKQPDHSASLGDSIAASTQIRFSVHTACGAPSSARTTLILIAQVSIRPPWFPALSGHVLFRRGYRSVVDLEVQMFAAHFHLDFADCREMGAPIVRGD